MIEPKGSGINVNGTSQELAKTRMKNSKVNGIVVNYECSKQVNLSFEGGYFLSVCRASFKEEVKAGTENRHSKTPNELPAIKLATTGTLPLKPLLGFNFLFDTC